jgi:cytochrome c5
MSLSKAGFLLAALLTLPLLPAAAQRQALEKGQGVYQEVCIACHAPANVMVSAPKAGDAAEWERRGGKRPGGLEMLTNHAVDGLGAMPPKGGHPELTRAQIRAAIDYMRRPSPDGSQAGGGRRQTARPQP